MWRSVLQNLIQSGSFRTQRELVRAIQARTGTQVNQATVSRELTALGARKVDGVYRLLSLFALCTPLCKGLRRHRELRGR